MAVAKPTTVTLRLSRRSRVAGTSRMDFTPAETTVRRVWLSTPRSADSSKVSANPWCTPPRPPVAKTRMPAAAASQAVAETVVAPLAPRARATGRSRVPSLRSVVSSATRASSSSSSPTWATPSSTATVAGQAPSSRAMASSSRATSRLRGRGRPWAMMVDSRASTGVPSRRARATSGLSRSSPGVVGCVLMNLPLPT